MSYFLLFILIVFVGFSVFYCAVLAISYLLIAVGFSSTALLMVLSRPLESIIRFVLGPKKLSEFSKTRWVIYTLIVLAVIVAITTGYFPALK